ncbi:hypothetical protein BOA8489_01616 [Boseongicola aestuarii]|uniref:Uncharacterized protein n=1 Tax=Boseongicola aestuarii TaxID=1470561 RepID=A0A238IYL4_9RHOB|nr:hypothetical protein BOA8489_01616 [Boseongicola aestuarii]
MTSIHTTLIAVFLVRSSGSRQMIDHHVKVNLNTVKRKPFETVYCRHQLVHLVDHSGHTYYKRQTARYENAEWETNKMYAACA